MIIKNKQKSFTLIELLVVIVIIGILAGVIMISTSSSIDKANVSKALVFSESIKNNLMLDLLSEWRFDDSSNLGLDGWGVYNGTLGDGITSTTYPTLKTGSDCVSGSCLRFDGGDYITVTSNGLNKFSYQSYTISAWVQVKDLQNYILIWSYDYTSHISPYYAQHLRFNGTGNVVFAWNDSSVNRDITTASGLILKDKWYHIVATFTSGRQKIYINAAEKASGTAVHTITYYGQPVWIGKSNFNITRDTFFDDLQFYNTSLSLSQVKQNYIAGLDSLFNNGNISKDEYNERINALAYE